jgi:hypothetical protein
MFDEFVAAEKFLEEADLLDSGLPISLEAVTDYVAKNGLEICYYDPREAPESVMHAAHGIDEVLTYQQDRATLFVNRRRPTNRQRFSIFHGIGHYVLPSHRGLNDLAKGCVTQKPSSKNPFERQADRFAAALNMPPCRYAIDMSHLPFGMQSIEKLAERYAASIESAAIHYVTLATEPCALVRLDRDYKEHGLLIPDSHLRVRYQVSNSCFPYRIKQGTDIPLSNELFWLSSQDEFLTSGVIKSEDLGLEPGTNLWVDCLPNPIGTVMALLYPGDREPSIIFRLSKAVRG